MHGSTDLLQCNGTIYPTYLVKIDHVNESRRFLFFFADKVAVKYLRIPDREV